MYPILFSFGKVTVYTYGFFIAVGFIAAISYVSHILKQTKSGVLTRDELYNLFFGLIISAITGARILYILVNFNAFLASPLDIFKIWQGGLVYYGGFIAAIAFFILYAFKTKKSFLKMSDIVAPALALGHFFGRIGCFFAGCCYGKECALPWSVAFTNSDSLAVQHVHVHPTQLYEAFANIALFVFLHFYNKKKHASGMTLAFYLIIYAVMRFTVEFFRGDFRGEYYLGLSISQIISLILFISGLALIVVIKRRIITNK
ncbi:MAG: prolipoprotein diacylglyceryl transferase [Endomicrobia bacterium]|nr:prolipoprotein diacylglyceryl transferase [Endomicrobiia bacterium]MCL2507036.1 prolipoprotein diacylglyceryl transferase [Endomicrobiia bacterium]